MKPLLKVYSLKKCRFSPMIKSIIVIILLLGSIAPAVSAPSSSKHKDRSHLPITIKSNELAADNKGKTAIFTGKVVAKQGDITIYAEKVTVSYGTAQGGVEQIEAHGAVRIVQQNRTGISSHAVYNSREGRITLTGDPKVIQGTDTISGEMITYFIDEERSVVTGGVNKRVEAVIQPPPRKANAGSR